MQIEKPAWGREPWHIHLSTYELSVSDGRIQAMSVCEIPLWVPLFWVTQQETVHHMCALPHQPVNCP